MRNRLTLAVLAWFGSGIMCYETVVCKDASQIAPAEKSHFVFSNLSLSDLKFLGLKPTNVQVHWTSSDRKAVEAQLQQIEANYPGLVELASDVNRIRIARVTTVDTVSGFRATAFGKFHWLVLSDAFFLKNAPAAQHHILIHELVHLADPDYYVAYSKEWIDIAKEIHSASGHNLKPEDSWYFRNVREILAEYFTFYTEGRSFSARQSFKSKIVPQLIHPTQDHKHWNLLLEVSKLHFLRGEYDQAMESLRKASTIAPNKPMVFHYLACTYIGLHDIDSAKSATVSMVNTFRDLPIPPDDGFAIGCIQTILGQVLAKNGRREANDFLAYLQKNFPDDKQLSKLKSIP